MPLIDEQTLKKQLSQNALEKVYLIFGADGLIKKKYCDKIVSTCVADGLEGFDFVDLDGRETTLDTLADELIRFPLMSQKRCVLLSDYNFAKQSETARKKVCEMIENLPDTTCFVIYISAFEIEYKKPENWKTLIKSVEKTGAVLNFGHKSPAELRAALREFCKRRGVQMDNSIVDYLIDCCSSDLNILKNEADKLCRYKANEGYITKDDIDLVCSKTNEAKIFDLTLYITQKNAPKALELMNSLLFSGVAPVQILTVMISKFLDIYRVGAGLSAGVSPREVGKTLGYRDNILFTLEKAQSLAQRLSRDAQRKCLDTLAEADRKIKSTGFDNRATLEATVLKLVAIIKGEVY